MSGIGSSVGRGVDVHLRDVRAFVAVAEHLHFSRAAEALFVSQPVLSRQVRALERSLRLELFIRDRRTTRLTPAGEALLPAAKEALAAWSTAQNAGAAAATAASAGLTVGISLGIERGLLPKVRAHLAQLAPAVELHLRRVPWSDPTSGLSLGNPPDGLRTVDAAFVWLPLPGGYRFNWVEVASEPRWLVMSSRHRLADYDSVAFADILHERFLALPATAGPARDFWLGVDARHGQPAPVAAEAASTEELVEALSAGTGICLIAEGNLDAFGRDAIAAVRVTGLAPSRLVLAWRRNDQRPHLQALIRATEDAVAEAGGVRAAR